MDWKLEVVVVPVTDVERAKRFYSEQVVPDIQAARAQLADRVDGPGDRWNSFIFFRDPDGNGWAVQEHPAD